MGKPEIQDKLTAVLSNHLPFTEEFHVVYVLVEARKLLDRDHNRKYPILRFYCNWCVHTDKDTTAEMRAIMEDIYHDVVLEIETPGMGAGKTKIVGFMYMEDLKDEIDGFSREYEIPVLLTEQDNWISFVKLLVSVLSDQPINDPCEEIRSFAFLPAADGCVRGRIDFTKRVGRYDYYSFGNVYE